MQKLSFPGNAPKCSRLTLWAIGSCVVFIFFILANLRLSDFLSHLCLGEGIRQGLALAAPGPVGSLLTQPGPASAPVPRRQGSSSRQSPHPWGGAEEAVAGDQGAVPFFDESPKISASWKPSFFICKV